MDTLTFEVDTHAQTHISGIQDLQSEFNGFNQSAIQSTLFKTCVSEFAKFQQNLGRFYTRLVFCNRKLMRTDIFFTRTTKPICNFANSGVLLWKESVYSDGEQFYQYQQNVQSPLTSNHFTYATLGYSKQNTSILLFIYKKDWQCTYWCERKIKHLEIS